MRTAPILTLGLLLLTACGSLQETAMVRDDVYDIPDRTIVASVDPTPPAGEEPERNDDYYDPGEAKRYESGSYWDRTYNDPTWYNRDRFGFGYSMSPWGSGWNMQYSTGWGNNWFNSPTGMYNPYWGNSWQSGYGAWGNPYGYYSPWNNGYYDPWGWNNGWGSNVGWGYNYGYSYPWCANPYGYGGGYYGNNWGWGGNYYGNEGWGNGRPGRVIAHRPGMAGAGGGAGTVLNPRAARQISLMPQPTARPATPERVRVVREESPDRTREQPVYRPSRVERERGTRPTRERTDRIETPRHDGGGGGRGGGGGGGSSPSPSPSPSPRPRR